MKDIYYFLLKKISHRYAWANLIDESIYLWMACAAWSLSPLILDAVNYEIYTHGIKSSARHSEDENIFTFWVLIRFLLAPPLEFIQIILWKKTIGLYLYGLSLQPKNESQNFFWRIRAASRAFLAPIYIALFFAIYFLIKTTHQTSQALMAAIIFMFISITLSTIAILQYRSKLGPHLKNSLLDKLTKTQKKINREPFLFFGRRFFALIFIMIHALCLYSFNQIWIQSKEKNEKTMSEFFEKSVHK